MIRSYHHATRSVRKDGKEIFGMAIPDALLTDEIKRAPYYSEYLELWLNDTAPKHTSSQPPKSTPAPTEPSKKEQGKMHKPVKETSDAPSPTKRSKAGKVTKKRMPKSSLQLVDKFVDEGVPEKEPAFDDEEANLQRALELSLKELEKQGPACSVESPMVAAAGKRHVNSQPHAHTSYS
ncbi:retrovirus-related pol polyprotein from transposon TNT 1-94 [Tanacetum coccineum]